MRGEIEAHLIGRSFEVRKAQVAVDENWGLIT